MNAAVLVVQTEEGINDALGQLRIAMASSLRGDVDRHDIVGVRVDDHVPKETHQHILGQAQLTDEIVRWCARHGILRTAKTQ